MLLSPLFIWKVSVPDEVLVVVVGLTVSGMVEMDSVLVVVETPLLSKPVDEAEWDASDEADMALLVSLFAVTLPGERGFEDVVIPG